MDGLPVRFARLCRSVAVALIGGFVRARSHAEIEARIAARPPREQALISGLALVALFLVSLLAAQGRIWGMLAFGGAVVLLTGMRLHEIEFQGFFCPRRSGSGGRRFAPS